MSDQELDQLFLRHLCYREGRLNQFQFRTAAREAIAAETRELVDALRRFANEHHEYPAFREAARLVAEFDAAQQKGT